MYSFQRNIVEVLQYWPDISTPVAKEIFPHLSGSATNNNLIVLSAIIACCILPMDHKILQYLVSSQTTKFAPDGKPLEHTQQTLASNNLVLFNN